MLPNAWQDRDGIKAPSQKGEGCDDEQGHNLKFLKSIGPNPNDKTNQTEGDGGENEISHHPPRVINSEGHKKRGGEQNDETEHDRFRRCRSHIAHHDLQGRERGRQELINSATEFWEINTKGRIGDALRQE